MVARPISPVATPHANPALQLPRVMAMTKPVPSLLSGLSSSVMSGSGGPIRPHRMAVPPATGARQDSTTRAARRRRASWMTSPIYSAQSTGIPLLIVAIQPSCVKIWGTHKTLPIHRGTVSHAPSSSTKQRARIPQHSPASRATRGGTRRSATAASINFFQGAREPPRAPALHVQRASTTTARQTYACPCLCSPDA